MKAKSKVQVRTVAGLVDAPCYFQWKQDVGGMDFEFALCIASGHTKGLQAPLAIHELSTGFDLKVVILHPNSRNPLTDKSAESMPSSQLRKLARAAFHRKINKQIGPVRFLQSVVSAQMLIAKIDGKIKTDVTYEGHPDQINPAQTLAAIAVDDAPAPLVIMPAAEHCLACEDTKVLTTTDKDHEGQPIEVACTECIPAPVEEVPPCSN